jgi:hypothetical protein
LVVEAYVETESKYESNRVNENVLLDAVATADATNVAVVVGHRHGSGGNAATSVAWAVRNSSDTCEERKRRRREH